MEKIIKVDNLEKELKIVYDETIRQNLLHKSISFMEFKNMYIKNMQKAGYNFDKIKKEFYLK